MEERSKDSVCSLYTNEDFANHITINLFKKKNNLRVSKVCGGKRKTMRNCLNNVNNAVKTKQLSLRSRNHESRLSMSRKNMLVDKSSQVSTDVNCFSDADTLILPSLDVAITNTTTQTCQTLSEINANDNFGVTNYLPVSSQQAKPQEIPPQPPLSSAGSPQPNLTPTATTTNSVGTTRKNTVSDDLTPLSWLQSLDMGGVVPHLAAPPTPPASPISNQNSVASDGGCKDTPSTPEKIDYSVDGSVKPPFSYAALIGMAMKENDNKMTLSAIYKWIKEHFVFYKTADQSWQNSIRHNLSLNKCFLKVARSKGEPGKGGFWKLDPEYADSLIDGAFKKRRPSKGTAPPTTKSKRKKPLFAHQIQQQVQKQKIRDQEEYMRQKEQEEAVRNLLQPMHEPVQAAYMPPPTDKPPSVAAMYMDHQEPIDRTLLVDESGNPVKEDFVWSSILGDENGQDESWQLGTQEVVTDITQSGDPSTYQLTASPTPSMTSLSSSTSSLMNNFNPHHQADMSQQHLQQQHQHHHHQQHLQTLPSFELSPESLGMEEDLFGSPEYTSETHVEERDSLISSFDLGVGLDLAVSTTSWESKTSSCNIYDNINAGKDCDKTSLHIPEGDYGTGMMMCVEGTQHELVELQNLEGNFTQLTTLAPAAPVVVQHVNSSTWNHEQNWEEARTLSLLEANLDFDKLIDLDVL